VVLVSSAQRAQETWTHVSELVRPGSTETRDEVYLANRDQLLEIVHGLPSGATTALIVGHNDGLEDFASWASSTPVTLKTSTYAVLRSDDPWSAWDQGRAELVDVVVAR